MREPDSIDRGQLVVLRNRKWDGTPHWVVPGEYLGRDGFGHWIWQPEGSFVSKPGYGFYAASDALVMVPHSGNHVVTFFDELHPKDVEIYVDIATDISWGELHAGRGFEVTLVDMDLDVIRTFNGPGTWIDDEDEFSAHQASMSYPGPVIEAMRAEADRIYAAVRDRAAPFDGTAAHWFRKARA